MATTKQRIEKLELEVERRESASFCIFITTCGYEPLGWEYESAEGKHIVMLEDGETMEQCQERAGKLALSTNPSGIVIVLSLDDREGAFIAK